MLKRSTPIAIIMLGIALVFLVAPGCMPAIRTDRDTVYQTSTISALMKGVFDGDVSLDELRPYGDFGLGTFQSLDGEMLELDGRFYRAKLDGSIVEVPGRTFTPFAVVTYFDNDMAITLEEPTDLGQLQSHIDGKIGSQNYFYAVKIEGKFNYVKTRSVPLQEKPYPTLNEAVKHQQVTEFHDAEGTMIGFRCPPYIDGVNVPGYHFHFLDKARKRGGHVLDCTASGVRVTIDATPSFVLGLQDTSGFQQVNLGAGQPEGLQQVEQGK